MPRLSGRQLACAALVLALFAPVYLAVGSPAFRPAWLDVRVATVPASVWCVLLLMVVFVVLTWAFSAAAFTERSSDDRSSGG